MKITIIHNVYTKNPLVEQTIDLNLLALNNSNIDFQYIIFNDNGDNDLILQTPSVKTIHDQIRQNSIEYYYSPINYGKKKCTGGWVGAEKENLIKGNIIHNIGQDDVMTPLFYQEAKKCFEDENNWFFTSNAFKVDEQLNAIEIMMHPEYQVMYETPFENFKAWFGVENDKVTRANNGMLASGTMYRRLLHNLIGLPDLDNFEGAADFEYWSRILFNGYKGKYLSMPAWYYRQSNYSTGNEIIDGQPNRGYWQQLAIEKIKQKYSKLYEEKYNG